jgi:hypothetical protein
MVRFRGVFLAVLAFLAASSCSDPAEWNPRGTVSWVQWRDGESTDGRYGQVTFRLTNTGRSSIVTADLAVRVVTERDEFYVQTQVKPDLPPGKSMFGTLEVFYRNSEDRGTLDGVTLESAAFH